jgi:CRISPR-associated protein Cmr3
MESIGNAELQSVFPPPMRTLAGAIRSQIGEYQQVDWQDFTENKHHVLREVIGDDDVIGSPLSFKGPFINFKNKRLYPAPLNLIAYTVDKQTIIHQLALGEPTHCDLGEQVQLPVLPEGCKKLKKLEHYWLKAGDFQQLLHGKPPALSDLLVSHDRIAPEDNHTYLYQQEPRLGIALNQQRRTVEESLLYQTRHLRLTEDISIDVEVDGLANQYLPEASSLLRLGAEGRMAHVGLKNTSDTLVTAPSADKAKGLILYLLTPAYFPATGNEQQAWHFLPDFEQTTVAGKTVWIGEIQGVVLHLHMAIIGRLQREGGWSLKERKPRTLKSLVPAGSCWYCTVENMSVTEAIKQLHGIQIGNEQQLGRGLIATGQWNS